MSSGLKVVSGDEKVPSLIMSSSGQRSTIQEFSKDASFNRSEEFEDASPEYKVHPAGESVSSLFTPEFVRRKTTSLSDDCECPSAGILAEIDEKADISSSTSVPPLNEEETFDETLNHAVKKGVERQMSYDLSPVLEGKAFLETQPSSSILTTHKNHVFILSDAGKPIYSRHGNEEEFLTLMGVMQALVSFVQTRDDSVESFAHGGWNFVFVRRIPLILVACSATGKSVAQLRQQLNFVYHQILSTLTRTQLGRIFENKKNFDLRRLLSGTEKTLSALLDMGSTDPSYLLCAVRCLALPGSNREALGQAIVASASKVKNLVFAILIARQQLITMVRLKKYTLHPSDLHLLINLVECNPSFRNAESWSPVCLPRFDDTGFLHAHISFLEETGPVCLLLLTVDRNAFFTMSEVRTKFLERLAKNKLLTGLTEACEAKQGIGLAEVGIDDVLHFLYKNRSSSQLCCSTFEPPYVSETERLRLIQDYLRLMDKVHNIEEFDQPLRILYITGEKEALLGWVTSNFELYTAFRPMITKQAAVAKVDKLMKWLKKEEERLFILNPLVF